MQKFNKVLLVDDDKAMNFLSGIVLRKLNIAEEIEVAEDGEIACELVEQKKCPDIIFLDIKMPRMDGFDFLNRFEKQHKCKHAKIVMLTSSTRPEDQEKALSYKSVVGYYEKPLTEEMINNITRKYF